MKQFHYKIRLVYTTRCMSIHDVNTLIEYNIINKIGMTILVPRTNLLRNIYVGSGKWQILVIGSM